MHCLKDNVLQIVRSFRLNVGSSLQTACQGRQQLSLCEVFWGGNWVEMVC